MRNWLVLSLFVAVVLAAACGPAPDVSPPEAQAASGSAIHNENRGAYLSYTSCYDLDRGLSSAADFPICDFSIHESVQKADGLLQFTPKDPAEFALSTLLEEEPTLETCQQVDLLGELSDLALQGQYLCYRTNEERYGYLTVTAMDAAGITFTWRTFTSEE